MEDQKVVFDLDTQNKIIKRDWEYLKKKMDLTFNDTYMEEFIKGFFVEGWKAAMLAMKEITEKMVALDEMLDKQENP